MTATLEILAGVIVILLVARFVLGVGPWTANLSTAQTALAIVAAVVAGFWYFVERPHAPKIRIEQDVTAAPLPGGRALVLAEVTVTNAGAQAIDLRHSLYRAYVQQVTPLPPAAAAEAGTRVPGAAALAIHDADNWGSLARTQQPLPSFLEAGEAESLYWRVVVPCQPQLRVYFTSRIPKPAQFSDRFFKAEGLEWVKQTLLDLGPACKESAKLTAKPPLGGRTRP